MVDSLLVLSLGVVWREVILKSTRDDAILKIAFLKDILEPYVFYDGITIPYTRHFLIYNPLSLKIPGRLKLPQMHWYVAMMATPPLMPPTLMFWTSQRSSGMLTIRELMDNVFS